MKKLMTLLMVQTLGTLACFATDNDLSEPGDFTPFISRHKTVRGQISFYTAARIDRSADHEENKDTQIALNFAKEFTDRLDKKTNYEFSNLESVNLLFQEFFGVIPVKVSPLEGGFVSGILYRVSTHHPDTQDKQDFYIKYLRKKPIIVSGGRCNGELANLDYLKQSPIIHKIQTTLTIVLPEMMLQYRTAKKKKLKNLSFFLQL